MKSKSEMQYYFVHDQYLPSWSYTPESLPCLHSLMFFISMGKSKEGNFPWIQTERK